MGSEHKRRQMLGRGLRLYVQSRWKPPAHFGVNTLTAIAIEDYEQFAENL